MKSFFLKSLLLYFLVQVSVFSQTVISQARTDGRTLPQGVGTLKLYGATHSASSLYTSTGEDASRFQEASDSITASQRIQRQFTVDFTGY